jgi:zinc transporter, ZIP family
MPESLLSYMLAPIAALLVGALVAAFRPPGPRLRSYTHHLAAGVVFAALTTEILPEMMAGKQNALDVILGFSAGVVLMLLIRHFTEGDAATPDKTDGDTRPASMMAAVGIDLLVDGLLLGIGFAVGVQAGTLITVALTTETFFVGLATAAARRSRQGSRLHTFWITSALVLPFAGGALLGLTLLSGLQGHGLEILLSFAAAALLYLVTKELLTEAHEVPETPLSTAMFFVGFLALFLIKLAM